MAGLYITEPRQEEAREETGEVRSSLLTSFAKIQDNHFGFRQAAMTQFEPGN